MDYILLPVPNRLITIIDINVLHPTIDELEAIKKLADDNCWENNDIKNHFPNFDLKVFLPWNDHRKYDFLICGKGIELQRQDWKDIFDEACEDTDPNFMIFMSSSIKVERIPSTLRAFL